MVFQHTHVLTPTGSVSKSHARRIKVEHDGQGHAPGRGPPLSHRFNLKPQRSAPVSADSTHGVRHRTASNKKPNRTRCGHTPSQAFKGFLFGFVQAPFNPAPAGNEKENEAIENSQLAFVYGGEERSAELELPVELEISHSHLAAAEKSCQACLKSQHYSQSAHQFDDPAEPELGPHRRLELGKQPQDFLGTVERKHEPRNNTHQGISVVRVLFKKFHECTLQLKVLLRPPACLTYKNPKFVFF